MPRKIYKGQRSRRVREAPNHEDEILASIRPLSMACRQGIFMVEEELESNDPDLDERCGLLADRYEVYAIRIPGCRGSRLVISLDFRAGSPVPAIIHGAVANRNVSETARRLATRHLQLVDPTWEVRS